MANNRCVPVMKCVDSLKCVLQSIAPLKGKILFVTNEDGLASNIKGVNALPAIGIIYEGMRSSPESGATAKLGASAEAVFALVLINRGTDIISTDETKVTTISLLDQVREQLLGTRSPTGHYWQFVVEAAADEKKGIVFWVQRWSTPIQLPAR